MIKGVLARTAEKRGQPLIDDLSHHMLIVASASLRFNDRNVTIASLIHDFFKGLMLWYNGNWWHFTTEREIYFEILEDLKSNFDVNKVIKIVTEHHYEKCERPNNPIRRIECSGLVKQVESKLFLLPEITGQDNFLKTIPLNFSSKYRFAVASILHEYLAKKLSRYYSKKFMEVLGAKTIRYTYVPIEDEITKLKTRDDALNFVKKIDLSRFKLKLNKDVLDIHLPVIRDFGDPFFIEYCDEETTIIVENGEIKGIRVSYGDALSMLVLKEHADRSNGALIYVDPDFEIDLKEIIDAIFEKIDFNGWLNRKNIRLVSSNEIAESIEGKYTGEKVCVFCGEKAGVKYEFGDRFTDAHQMLFSGDYTCPACLFGFFLEDIGYENLQIPQPAHILESDLQSAIPIKKDFAYSIAGNIWLKVLSKLWFDLSKRKDGYKYSDWLLNPRYLLTPLEISFAPQFMYPAIKGGRRKKFILESSLRHGVVCYGSEIDLTVNDFSEIVKFVRDYKEKSIKCLGALKNIYGITSLPKPPKRGGGSGKKSRKRR